MTPTIALLIALVCAVLSLLCEHAERKSKLWYHDRAMLRMSGMFAALAIVAVVLAIFP